MLRSLSLSNFRSWESTGEIQLAPLTGFFGTNSSGKSSLLRFLLMLKQTTESNDRSIALDFGSRKDSYVDIGTPLEAIHGHSKSRALKFGLQWTSDANSADDVQLEATFRLRDGELLCQSMRYESSGFHAGLSKHRAGYRFASSIDVLPSPKPNVPGPVRSYLFPNQVRYLYDYLRPAFDRLEGSFESALASVLYLGPLRDEPARRYARGFDRSQGVGARGEFAIGRLIEAQLEESKKPRRTSSSAEKVIAEWLVKLGLLVDFKVAEEAPGVDSYRALVRQSPGGPWISLTDVGFGVSQILPVLVLCFTAQPGSTLIFEQPEIHLHPSVQMGLADVFIDAIRLRKVQILVESHSEHFLQRLLRRTAEHGLAEEGFDPASTALYFCDRPGISSTIERLVVNEYGGVTNWPRNFFGDPLGEALSTEKAGSERRLRSAS